jgi:hypothetical protein
MKMEQGRRGQEGEGRQGQQDRVQARLAQALCTRWEASLLPTGYSCLTGLHSSHLLYPSPVTLEACGDSGPQSVTQSLTIPHLLGVKKEVLASYIPPD